MKTENLKIGAVPAVIYGDNSDSVFLFVHGKSGCKEEAEDFAQYALPAEHQVISIDLPQHGERAGETGGFDPWHAVPELTSVMKYIRGRWKNAGLRANSIGAWFSMLAFGGERFEKCLFVSPILDMNVLISRMMEWAGVSEKRLREEKIIKTSFGETLSEKYFDFAKQAPIEKWDSPTSILYAGGDDLTSRTTLDAFARKFGCSVEVMENGEHWFHTPDQMDFLHRWTEKELK